MLVRLPCHYCGGKACTKDHYLPIDRGGDSEWDNLVPACKECNELKDNMTAPEFLAFCRDILLYGALKFAKHRSRARAILSNLAPEMIPGAGSDPHVRAE